MNEKEIKLIFGNLSLQEEQKRMDEICGILYELYCQYQKEPVRKNNQNNLAKEAQQ